MLFLNAKKTTKQMEKMTKQNDIKTDGRYLQIIYVVFVVYGCKDDNKTNGKRMTDANDNKTDGTDLQITYVMFVVLKCKYDNKTNGKE